MAHALLSPVSFQHPTKERRGCRPALRSEVLCAVCPCLDTMLLSKSPSCCVTVWRAAGAGHINAHTADRPKMLFPLRAMPQPPLSPASATNPRGRFSIRITLLAPLETSVVEKLRVKHVQRRIDTAQRYPVSLGKLAVPQKLKEKGALGKRGYFQRWRCLCPERILTMSCSFSLFRVRSRLVPRIPPPHSQPGFLWRWEECRVRGPSGAGARQVQGLAAVNHASLRELGAEALPGGVKAVGLR